MAEDWRWEMGWDFLLGNQWGFPWEIQWEIR